MIYKNWKAICAVPNSSLRLFVAMATNPILLRSLARGFPQLFTSKRSPNLLRIPASALREAASTNSHRAWDTINHPEYEEWDRELTWVSPAYELNLVHIVLRGKRIPNDLRKQLVGRSFRSGIKVRYKGRSYFVIGLIILGVKVELGAMYNSLEKLPRITSIALAPCALIDMST